ncbi:MAG: crossover junction endodeoxyribonuclease RuvC [Myxococcota bacterium]
MQTEKRRFILGMDPGSIKTGYAVIELKNKTQFVYRECGIISANPKQPLEKRLLEIGSEIEEIIQEYPITEAAVENVFSAFNVKSALVLGQARGMILYIISRAGIPVFSYAPNKIKKYITGRGKAAKEQVRQSVTLLSGLSSPPAEDASDALAVAICHSMHKNPLGTQ